MTAGAVQTAAACVHQRDWKAENGDIVLGSF